MSKLGVASLVLLVACGFVLVFLLPRDSQSGEPVPDDPRSTGGVGLTTYCLPDGSGMRVYERPFPQGGTQPLFSVVYAGDLPVGNPARCGTWWS